MSKPIQTVGVATSRGKFVRLPALFDTGSFYSIIRQDCLPRGTIISATPSHRKLRAASRGSRLRIAGAVIATFRIGRKEILHGTLVSPDLVRELIIGAGAMQEWDITVKNTNGHTKIIIPRDMHDPETTEVD
jgi:hypothetical protein